MLTDSDDPAQRYYNFQEDLDRIAENLGTTSETVRAAVRYLEKREYIKYMKDQHGNVRRFYLDHKGLHWKEFRREEITEYILEKWIDFAAMLVSLISLAISIAALLQKTAGQ